MKVLLIILLLFVGRTVSEDSECSEDKFRCANGERCIEKAFVCDEVSNCLDKSDEDPELCESWTYEDEEDSGGWDWGYFGNEDGEDTDQPSVDDDQPSVDNAIDEYDEDDDENEIDFEDDYSAFEETEEVEEMKKESCSRNICLSKGPLRYIDGKEYTYNYELVTRTQVQRPENQNQSSSFVISAHVKLQVLTACEMSLKVENITVRSSEPNSDGQTVLMEGESIEKFEAFENSYIRFSAIGGEIDTVCPSEDEESDSVNFKKSIISMLQNTMPKLHIGHTQKEKDIVGECNMMYSYAGFNGKNLIILKERDINSCKHRSDVSSFGSGILNDFPSNTNPLDIIDTRSKCVQEIRSGVIQNVSCTEEHNLTPFSYSLRTVITQKLELIAEEDSIFSWPQINKRTDLLFDHDGFKQGRSTTNSGSRKYELVDLADDILDKIEKFYKDDVQESANPSTLFKSLVQVLRMCTVEELEQIKSNWLWSSTNTNYLEDAIGMVGTASSIKYITKEIKTKEMKPALKSSWIHSISFMQRIDIETISALSELLDVSPKYPEISMHVGTALHTFCSKHSLCSTLDSVKSIVRKFGNALGQGCRHNSEIERMQVLMTLRGIGNAGTTLDDDIVRIINRCILDEENDMETVGTAIQAYRRVPCSVSRNALEEVFHENQKDSEIRILAYLGLMKCADYTTIQIVENVLMNEEVNQVGSFIWTHLTNLQEASSPQKFYIQSLLSNRVFIEKFQSDFRKFSRNFEWSGFYEAMNIGSSLESNIIFSQKSYIPRSVSLNVSADLFGRSFNFIEVGARVDGIEKYMEQFLKGDQTPTRNENAIASRSINSFIENSHRRKEYIDNIPKMSFSVKYFGNDITYHQVQNLDQLASRIKNMNLKSLLKYLETEQEFTMSKASLPLESSISLPTSSGFPLKFGMDGSASIKLSSFLKMDLKNVHLGKLMVKGHLKPSVSLDAVAFMKIESGLLSTGVEVDTSVHSTTSVDGKIDINGKNDIEIDMNIPQDRIKVLSASTKMSLLHKSKDYTGTEDVSKYQEIVQSPDASISATENCISLVEYFGVRVCSSTKIPRTTHSRSILAPGIPFIPLLSGYPRIASIMDGPHDIRLNIKKTDVKLKSYKFRYKFVNYNEELQMQLLYNTPQSSINREHTINLGVDYEAHKAHFEFRTPIRSFEAKGDYIWTPEIKRLNSSILINRKQKGSVVIGYKIHSRSGQSVVIPVLQIEKNNVQLFKLSGTLNAQERKSASDAIHYSVGLNFEVETAGKDETTRGERGTGVIEGFVNNEAYNWELNLDTSYSFGTSGKTEKMNVYYKRDRQPVEGLLKVVRTWRASFTQFPNLNTKGSWGRKTFPGSVENAIQASFGADFANPQNQVDFYQNFILFGGFDQTTFNSTVAIKYPKKNVDLVLGIDFYRDPRDLITGFKYQYATGEAIDSRLHLVRNNYGPLEVDGNFFFIVPGLADWRLDGKIKEKENQVYKFEFDASVSSVYRLELSGDYTDLSTRLRLVHNLKLKMKVPFREEFYTNTTVLYDPDQVALVTQVTTKNGSKYKVRLAYSTYTDDYFTKHKKIEVDLDLVDSIYFWHSEISIGEFFTMTNDIHIDRYRDINLWIQLMKNENKPTSVEINFLWDANRDPQKKASLKLIIEDNKIRFDSLLSILGVEYRALWTSTRYWAMQGNWLTEWSHDHKGEITWLESRRRVHKIDFGASFDLNRSNGARLTAKAYLITPLDNWKNNTLKIEYTRTAEQILAEMNIKWHVDEFMNLKFNSGLMQRDQFKKGEILVEIFSLINDNLVTFRAGSHLQKRDQNVDGKVFLQWDKDEVQLIVQANDESDPFAFKGNLLAKVLTTLEGYSHLSNSLSLYMAPNSIAVQGTAKWEDVLYELKAQGDIQTAKEYLIGEVTLTTPQYGPKTLYTKVRVFHDSKNHGENLVIVGHWLNEEFSINARRIIFDETYQAIFDFKIPHQMVSSGSITAGISSGKVSKGEIWVNWNEVNDYGIRLKTRTISLTDFLLSLALKLPVEKLKDVEFEIKNLFELSPSVKVNSRVYGKSNDKKYGLGCIYEQGLFPKLRVGLELYYPSADLEEVKFDIADNSTETNVRYNFELRHGSRKHIHVNTDFMKTQEALEFSLGSGITLGTDEDSKERRIDFKSGLKFYWKENTDFVISVSTDADAMKFKILTNGSLKKDSSLNLSGNFMLPIFEYENIDYDFQSKVASGVVPGYFRLKVNDGRIPILSMNLEGTFKNLKLSFKTPFEKYRYGSLEYKFEPLDIIKSSVTGNAAMENQNANITGLVYLNNKDDITNLQIHVKSTLEDYQRMDLILEGFEDRNGFKNKIKFITERVSYNGEIFYRIYSPSDWTINAKIVDDDDIFPTEFMTNLEYQNVPGDPFRLMIELDTPEDVFGSYSTDLKIQSLHEPYDLLLEWNIPMNSGNLEIILENFEKENILGSIEVDWESKDGNHETIKIKSDLTNKSTMDIVDVGLNTEISTNHEQWNYILVNGRLTQITDEPGILNVYLVWPEMSPVNFTAKAKYVGEPFVLKTDVNLNLTTANYGFLGEITKDEMITINGGIWWHKNSSLEIQKIRLTTTIEHVENGFHSNSVLYLPMAEGLNEITAVVKSLKNGDWNDINGSLTAGKMKTTLTSMVKMGKFPALQGNVTIISSILRGGNPVNLDFNQVLTSDGFKGDYELVWPVYDMKSKKYINEFLRADLKHRFLSIGNEGVLNVVAPFTKGKPVSVSYAFKFPKESDFIVRLAVSYQAVEFDVKVSQVATRTRANIRKKTSFQLSNLVWPFGIDYLETIPLNVNSRTGAVGKLVIYDLTNQDRQTSLTLSKDTREGYITVALQGIIAERILELRTVYENRDRKSGVLVSFSWSDDEKLNIAFDVQDNSQSPSEHHYVVSARVSHPLRDTLTKLIYIKNEKKFSADVSIETNLLGVRHDPINILAEVSKNVWTDAQKQLNGVMKISHSSLSKDVIASFEAKSTSTRPLNFEFLLQYSPETDRNLEIEAVVEKDRNEYVLYDFVHVKHVSSSLELEARGGITAHDMVYAFDQDFKYTDNDGVMKTAKVNGKLDIEGRKLITQIDSTKKLLDINVRIDEIKEGEWKIVTETDTHEESIPGIATLAVHPKKPFFVLAIDNSMHRNRSLESLVYDVDYPRYNADEIIIEGGFEDGRFLHGEIRHKDPLLADSDYWVQDFDFAVKLNNSQLLFSRLNWRKMAENELKNELRALSGLSKELRANLREWIKEGLKMVAKEAAQRVKPILGETVQALKPLAGHFKNESVAFRTDFLTLFRNIKLSKEEIDLKNAIKYIFGQIGNTWRESSLGQRVKAALAKGTLKNRILAVIEKVKAIYIKFKERKTSLGSIVAKVKEWAGNFASYYDNTVKQWYLTFRNSVREFRMRLREWLRSKWHKLYYDYKPHILQTLHHIESATYSFVTTVLDIVKQFGGNFKSLTLVQNIEEIINTLTEVYYTMSEKSLRGNIEYVYNYLSYHIWNGFHSFIDKVFPFLEDWLGEINNTWVKLRSYESFDSFVKFVSAIFNTVYDALSKIDYREHVISTSAFLLENSYDIVQETAVHAHMSNIKAKSDMVWKPSIGEIKLVQKLPFVWTSLKEKPEITGMVEIPIISYIKDTLFSKTDSSYLDKWYRNFNFIFDKKGWLPPFPATGYIVGESHIITFDGKILNFKGTCEHLLAADLLHNQWAVALKYHSYAPKTVVIYADGRVIKMSDKYKIKIDRYTATLPLKRDSIYMWRSDGAVHVAHDNGLEVSWNMVHDVVSVKLPRDAFLNTAGILGTNNNEPMDDMQLPDRTLLTSEDDQTQLMRFMEAWKVEDSVCYSPKTVAEPPTRGDAPICQNLFVDADSPFKFCFNKVDPEPYHEICVKDYKGAARDSSAAALAYREKCNENFVPIKLPVDYVQCQYTNGTTGAMNHLREGQTILLRREEIEKAVDVVFIVELNSCNEGKLDSKQFQSFMLAMEIGLRKEGIKSVRIALVVYGGPGPNSGPTVVSIGSEIFTSPGNVLKLVENLDFSSSDNNLGGKQSTDGAFNAVTYASNLPFRSPVDVAMVLFPCSSCAEANAYDYSTMLHIIKNNAATLYVFKDGYFDIGKESIRKKIIGYDKENAYQLKDLKKKNMGDTSLKNQITHPKQQLNLCIPLALESGGALYTSEYVKGPMKKVERFGQIVGRRAGQSVQLEHDQRCLCLSTQEITPLLRCEIWEHGDISVLERYGMNEKPESLYTY